jgi:membrane protease YdiL (CAAX protease family)
MHIIPGLLVTGAFILFKLLLDSSGYPPLLAFLLAVLLVDLPFLMGVMLYEGKKLNGHYSLNGVIGYREKIPWKTFVWIFIAAGVAAYGLITLSAPLSNALQGSLFSWLPGWMILAEQTQYNAYSKNVLLLTFSLQLVVTGVLLPWVEEMYFRGYLLPRISRFGKAAPLLGGIFFGLYHVWQLYGFVSVLLMGVLLSYLVWWKRDLRLSISMHIFANALAVVMSLMLVLSM